MRNNKKRLGIACVELAIGLPLLVLVGFSSLAICNYLSMQQVASRIAFDVCRKMESDGLTSSQAEDLALQQITALGFQGTADVTDSAYTSQTRLSTVELTVTSNLQKSFALLPSLQTANAESSILRRD